jgi:small subunit ribosomal protein S6
MSLYENVFIARQDVSASQVDALADQFAALIQEHGGEVTKKEHWGLRNLSFRIKKNRKGHYVLFNIDAPSEAVLEMERNMRLSEDVIRYLTVRVDELEADQSIVLRSRGMRDDRGRGGRRFGGPDRGHDRGGPRGGRDEARPRDGSGDAKKPAEASTAESTEGDKK